MTSDIQIVNMALSKIGTSAVIESFTERSAEARVASIWYDYSRRNMLSLHDWTFARRRQTLALSADAAPDGWMFRYQYPADCLRFRLIYNPAGLEGPAIPFEVGTSLDGLELNIFTNLDDAIGLYTFDNTSETTFNEVFIDLLATYLASQMALAITGKNSVKNRLDAEASRLLVASRAFDSNEEVDSPLPQAEWITARL